MSIAGINSYFKPIAGIAAPQQSGPIQSQPPGPAQPQSQKTGESFADFFGNAIKEVNSMQLDADKQIEGVVLGGGRVSTHDAMIALEKADIAFQLMNQIRGRIVRAYEEVMRTQV